MPAHLLMIGAMVLPGLIQGGVSLYQSHQSNKMAKQMMEQQNNKKMDPEFKQMFMAQMAQQNQMRGMIAQQMGFGGPQAQFGQAPQGYYPPAYG